MGRALESLRNSDFDTLSAIGEVIDNSIEAKTKKIHISLDIKIQDRKRELLKEIALGDDGYGMDRNVLHRCLQLGYSTTYNERTGIGRFGVGNDFRSYSPMQTD